MSSTLKHSTLLCLALASLAGCATAPETQSTEGAPAAKTASADPNAGLICKSYNTTGSRVRREKVCLTESDWKRVNEDAEETTRAYQAGGSTQPGGQVLPVGP